MLFTLCMCIRMMIHVKTLIGLCMLELKLLQVQLHDEKDCIVAKDVTMVLAQWEMPMMNCCEKEVITLDLCPVIYLEEE